MDQGDLSASSWTATTVRMMKFQSLGFQSDIVRDLLLQLGPYKSMEPGGIHPRIFKELDDVITKPLSMILEWSWEYSEVPADWKLVNVVPVFKKDKKEDPGNYRPVSVTSVIKVNLFKIMLADCNIAG
ncbi:RNA-directed DNA polymerase from mobile element jockey [Willisornis vidua]|uniref:RNA-directed DNA polymerase from mobile element jockey n=1 Tax=Willisornis vidua TaxID=1566151 RepID=A0ABQ9CLR8_9PASS|nr:RNA-directed DNA polymerase from mobile element jockey [Willisornis vidua]